MSFNQFQLSPEGNLTPDLPPPATISVIPEPSVPQSLSNPVGSFEWDREHGDYSLQWKTWAEMERWMKGEQDRLNINFTSKEKQKNKQESRMWLTKHIFVCSRGFTGGRKEKASNSAPKPTKTTEATRIGCKCRLTVKTYPNTDAVLGLYVSEHSHPTGTSNTRYIRLPKHVRENIEVLLRMGVEPAKVLEQIHGNIYSEGNLENLQSQAVLRRQFCTRADIRRVERAIEEETIRLAPNDSDSVLRWAKELERRGYFVLLKTSRDPPPAGSGLAADAFVLLIQTSYQRECWIKHGRQFAGIDATHNTTHYENMSLFTLLVRDRWGHGMPAAWMISSNATEETISFFLQTIRRNTPDIIPDIFMSDKDHAQLNAIKRHYSGSTVFLCWWHVLHAWRQHFSTKNFPDLWDLLKKWIRITDVKKFWATWELIKEKAPESVREYLETYWLIPETLKMWSAVFRTERNILQRCDTNMLVEAWHHLLKGNFMEGKRNRRMDHLIYLLVDRAIPFFIQRHRRQEHGFEGADLEVQARIRIQKAAQAIRLEDMTSSADEPDVYFVKSEAQPGLVYRVDLDAYDCECANFTSIFFCKHICAVQRHFCQDNDAYAATQCDIHCVDTFAPIQPDAPSNHLGTAIPVPGRSPETLMEGAALSPGDGGTSALISRLSGISFRLQSLQRGSLDPSTIALLHDSLDAFCTTLDRNTSAPPPLPPRQTVAPNQHTWTETSSVMINAKIKTKKRKIHTDPYAGGEQSGKKARPDAREALLSAATNIGGASTSQQTAQASPPATGLDLTSKFDPASVDLSDTKLLSKLHRNKELGILCKYYGIAITGTNESLIAKLYDRRRQ